MTEGHMTIHLYVTIGAMAMEAYMGHPGLQAKICWEKAKIKVKYFGIIYMKQPWMTYTYIGNGEIIIRIIYN